MALAVAAAAVAALFLMAPLRGATRSEQEADGQLERIREEREAVYDSISDLDHDFETGKVEAADYEAMRAEFLAQAIELMRAERGDGAGASQAEAAGAARTVASSGVAPVTAPSGDVPVTGTFCPACGERIDERWRFCSHCGGALNPPEALESSEAGRDEASDA